MLLSLAPAVALAEDGGEEGEIGPTALPPRDETQYDLDNGFYLVGSFNNWTPSEAYRMKWNNYDESYGVEYRLVLNLTEGDELKVMEVENGAATNWYPGGDNYIVPAEHAGKQVIYFRSVYQNDWADFDGYFWITDRLCIMSSSKSTARRRTGA